MEGTWNRTLVARYPEYGTGVNGIALVCYVSND